MGSRYVIMGVISYTLNTFIRINIMRIKTYQLNDGTRSNQKPAPDKPAPKYVCGGCGCRPIWDSVAGWYWVMKHAARCSECNENWAAMEKRYGKCVNTQAVEN